MQGAVVLPRFLSPNAASHFGRSWPLSVTPRYFCVVFLVRKRGRRTTLPADDRHDCLNFVFVVRFKGHLFVSPPITSITTPPKIRTIPSHNPARASSSCRSTSRLTWRTVSSFDKRGTILAVPTASCRKAAANNKTSMPMARITTAIFLVLVTSDSPRDYHSAFGECDFKSKFDSAHLLQILRVFALKRCAVSNVKREEGVLVYARRFRCSTQSAPRTETRGRKPIKL